MTTDKELYFLIRNTMELLCFERMGLHELQDCLLALGHDESINRIALFVHKLCNHGILVPDYDRHLWFIRGRCEFASRERDAT